MIAKIAEQAADDADRVINFLAVAGLAPSPGQSQSLPAELLTELGAAMRVQAWEAAGLDLREYGLPNGWDAAFQAFENNARRLEAPSYTHPSLRRTLLKVTVERLAWAGPRDLHAEILLDIPDEDALVDALARFLWNQRAHHSLDPGSLVS